MPIHSVEKDGSVSSWHCDQRHDHEGAVMQREHHHGCSAAEGALFDVSEIRSIPRYLYILAPICQDDSKSIIYAI